MTGTVLLTLEDIKALFSIAKAEGKEALAFEVLMQWAEQAQEAIHEKDLKIKQLEAKNGC